MLLLVFLTLFSGIWASVIPIDQNVEPLLDEDATLTVPELIVKYGYPCETYQVVTPDGYILTLHRIPHGKNQNVTSDRVAFLMHGLLSSSADWIISGADKGFAYMLADEGYDIWMGNARGNHHSRNHTTLSPESSEFWQFSWHEIGYYDLPTMIDFVLATTGQPDMFYVGHSQGTTSFFVMTSSLPDYNSKIKAQFSLAPIAYMNHMVSPLLQIMAFWQGGIGLLLDIIGINEFLPQADWLAGIADILCGGNSLLAPLCSNALFAICGFSPEQMNITLLPVLSGHTPAGSSTKQLLHYAQGISSGHFRQYDFGLFGNLDKYGSMFPPDYVLEQVSAPVYLLYSHNDWLAAETDVLRLYDRLPNVKGRFLITEGGFNHLDYMYAIDATNLVYNKLISLMARH